jgi:hypothetical protein
MSTYVIAWMVDCWWLHTARILCVPTALVFYGEGVALRYQIVIKYMRVYVENVGSSCYLIGR